jgi:NADH dehydrogenase FAD-containing subunit
VEVRTGVHVTDINSDGVMIGDEHIAAKNVIWTAGVAVKAVKVTELLSVEEARGALGKASNIQLDQESAEQIASQRGNLMPHVQG